MVNKEQGIPINRSLCAMKVINILLPKVGKFDYTLTISAFIDSLKQLRLGKPQKNNGLFLVAHICLKISNYLLIILGLDLL